MITLDLPIPPSTNRYWRTFRGRILVSAEGRAYQREVCAELVCAEVREPLTGPLAVEVILHAPDRRRRDLDNLGKALLDALTKAGVYRDDSQIDDLRIRRGDLDALRPRVVVTVRGLESKMGDRHER